METLHLHQYMLLERLFFMAVFLLLLHNVGKLIEVDGNLLFINLAIVRDQIVILFTLIYFIAKMPETAYRLKVLRWLKFFLFVFSAGSIASAQREAVPIPASERE